MVATHYEKINTHLFLHAPLGFVSFKPKKKKTTLVAVDMFHYFSADYLYFR